ncbi:TPA: phage tail tape measure protein [Vibrio parahaemolyticus]|uniref:phage tail tape measure protein n=1 Tax=Vibrio parahaemolyticus TaxID=670 RepID=UPI00112413AB|nr:phage tail tape measure protein [Vibrio parahaemolyticus]TPA59403.1 phage tail tape measure protein [Vibrio parahaemolyticus]HCE1301199.1 phage tail tape measure protein [Vibrio parahaemolyticus]HCE1593085.1 phage tail tape measure protein [Vibrio parahaemolyticus]HCG7785596.1 phage tail tape measure protein [Vibrio parahaemolyticus]HCG8351303.1 phage tail tape measure protein [Vibrio parahaemolyticus]
MAGRNVTIGNVNIAMSANAAKLIQQTEQAQKSFKASLKKMMKNISSFNSKVGTMAGSIRNLSGSLTRLGLVGTGTTAALGTLGYTLYENQREMQRMATTAGMTVEEYSKLTHVTNSLGLENEYLADALKDLNVRVVDAASGGGALVDFFLSIGESAEDWMKLDPVQQFSRFQETISRMDASTAKFWADEVNDSMYRLSTTMSRSGRTLSDFVNEADSLGAGTSGKYIGRVNEMYESFHRLNIIVREIAYTTMALFSKTLTSVFDEAVRTFKGMVDEGETAGGVIFKLSKQIATNILEVIQTATVQIQKFVYKVMLLLGKIDSSFLSDLKDQALIDLIEVEKKISDIEERITQSKKSSGLHSSAIFGLDVENLSKQLDDLKRKRDELNKEVNSGFISGLIEEVSNVSYTVPKEATREINNQSKARQVLNDNIREGVAIIEQLKATQDLSSKAALRELQVQKAKIKAAKEYYETIKLTDGNKEALQQRIKDANNALKSISETEKQLKKKIADEEREQERKDKDEKLKDERSYLNARLRMAKEFYNNSRMEAKYNYELQKLDYDEQLKDELITKEEHSKLMENLALQRAHNEIAIETTKYAQVLDGMSYFFNESKTMAKAAFALTKGVALSETLIAQYQAVAQVWASKATWYEKVFQSAQAAAAVGSAIAGIQGVQGQFHNGGQIPRDGTYYMEGGEIVIPKDRVGEYIDAVNKQNEGQGGGTVINSTINMGANLVDEKVMAQALAKQQSTIAALVRKEQKKRPLRN